MCENTIIQTSVSPNHKYKLVLYQRDCGVTTGFSSQISLLDIDEKLDLENDSGNIYIANGYPDNFKITWISNNSVIIKRPQTKTYRMKKEVNNISFTYLQLDDNKSTQTPTSSKLSPTQASYTHRYAEILHCLLHQKRSVSASL